MTVDADQSARIEADRDALLVTVGTSQMPPELQTSAIEITVSAIQRELQSAKANLI